MSRFVRILLGMALLALILAAGASSRPSDDESTAPTLLSPAYGASFTSGTPAVFQIRTFAGDESGSLWLLVSRSSDPVDPCGTIGHDVELEQFTPTSDPAVFEAAPTHYKGDWMDTPGTYYWQAYRIYYGAGADGCIESEVRPFTITKPPVIKRAPKPLRLARLQGDFRIRLTVRATFGIRSVTRGRIYSERWTFRPRCSKGACHTRVTVSSLYATLGGWALTLKRSGALYRKNQRATLVQCFYKPVGGPLSVSVKVTKGAWVGDVWRATRITGSFRHSVGSTVSGIYHCPAGSITATLRGTLSE
jgi:hypothetical protein